MRMHQFVASIVTLALSASIAFAGGGTAFTYQGRLTDAGEPAKGLFDFEFGLWDAANGGNPIGVPQMLLNTPVTDGLFTVQIDFGAEAFDNAERWLEIVVDGVTLMPRQPITRAPYSIQTRGIYVDQDQNVGIGTTAPSYPLHVESSAASPIYGLYTGNGGSRYGVYGRTDSGAATRGVFGYASTPNGFTLGVQGRSDSIAGTGVEGFAFASSGLNYGIRGVTNSPDGYAGYFIGRAHVSDTLFVGRENPITSAEYFGFNAPVNTGYGGMYVSTDGDAARPFYGYSAGGDVDAFHYYEGVAGEWRLFLHGADRFTVGFNEDLQASYIDAPVSVFNTGPLNVDNIFNIVTIQGDLDVNGTLTKNAGAFRIDHPLDPENKYLQHSFVESPDMMNVYNGNVILDENGKAFVRLPDYFDGLNRDFRYQLTPMGAAMPNLHIGQEIANNSFRIAGGKAGMKVSWQVTGIRHDPWAEAHRIEVEPYKRPEHQGKYLNPELYGRPKEMAVHYFPDAQRPVTETALAKAQAGQTPNPSTGGMK